MNFWPKWSENKPFALVLLVLLAYLIVFLGFKIDKTGKEISRINQPAPTERSISVNGQGKIVATPDIASISFGVESKAEAVPDAQKTNTETVNTLIDKVKALGVEAKDIQTTSYSVYENKYWDPTTGQDKSRGWIVTQQLSLKVRDTSKISSVLQVVAQNGATNIYGPNFTIDDPSELQAQARAKAIADANDKAVKLAGDLGVRLIKVIGFSESAYPTPYYDSKMYFGEATGMGGGGSPTIEPGSNEISANVVVTYLLAQ